MADEMFPLLKSYSSSLEWKNAPFSHSEDWLTQTAIQNRLGKQLSLGSNKEPGQKASTSSSWRSACQIPPQFASENTNVIFNKNAPLSFKWNV